MKNIHKNPVIHQSNNPVASMGFTLYFPGERKFIVDSPPEAKASGYEMEDD